VPALGGSANGNGRRITALTTLKIPVVARRCRNRVGPWCARSRHRPADNDNQPLVTECDLIAMCRWRVDANRQVSKNASQTQPAKLLAMIFAKKGSTLTTPGFAGQSRGGV
jgi:hypothetical protein